MTFPSVRPLDYLGVDVDLLSFTEFYRVLLGFHWFQRVDWGSIVDFYPFFALPLSFYETTTIFTEFYRVLPSFTEFFFWWKSIAICGTPFHPLIDSNWSEKRKQNEKTVGVASQKKNRKTNKKQKKNDEENERERESDNDAPSLRIHECHLTVLDTTHTNSR